MAQVFELRELTRPKAQLGPGLHAAQVEQMVNDVVHIRTAMGQRCTATLGFKVEREWIEECMKEAQLVIVTDSEAGPLVIGALTTHRPAVIAKEGTLTLEAENIAIRAQNRLDLASGPTTLALTKQGNIRLQGTRAVLDVSANVRVLSALVELP